MRPIEMGHAGEVTVSQVRQGDSGKWQTVAGGGRSRKDDMYRARLSYVGHDGRPGRKQAMRTRRADAETAVRLMVSKELASGDSRFTPDSPFIDAMNDWFARVLADEHRASSTKTDYARTVRYLQAADSGLSHLTIEQANDTQRLERALAKIENDHGPGTMKHARVILRGTLQKAVSSRVQSFNAARQLDPRPRPPIPAAGAKSLSLVDRDLIVSFGYEWAAQPDIMERTRRNRRTAADLVSFLAGTGVRISEGRCIEWADVHLDDDEPYAWIRGTKTEASTRRVDLPGWLVDRLRARADDFPTDGYVFATPNAKPHGDQPWNPSNAASTLAALVAAAGTDKETGVNRFAWVTPHTFRKTVATLLDKGGEAISDIADTLGHRDASMTMTYYLSRDAKGSKAKLVKHL
jgi:integrase